MSIGQLIELEDRSRVTQEVFEQSCYCCAHYDRQQNICAAKGQPPVCAQCGCDNQERLDLDQGLAAANASKL